MKKIFLKAYINYNLGDDIFIKILTNRYSEYFVVSAYYNYRKNYKLKVINKKLLSLINKIIKVISSGKKSYENYLISKCYITVIIGGSLFIENDTYDSLSYFINSGKQFYILGSNFGPYKTVPFFNKFYDVFSQATDVCFRDDYSYELFKELPNVRKASDIVFSLDTKKIKIKNTKKVIFSVIDVEKKIIENNYKEEYERKIIDLIMLFNKKNYKIMLMSFCKAEGDERAINSILSKISDKKLKKNIEIYNYAGDIDEALDVIADCQIIVGTRFHANILGLVMDKTVIPIAYSDKTLNVLRDINFKGKIFDIRNKDAFQVSTLTDKDLTYKLDVSFQKKDAERHFEKLDIILEKNNN